MHATIIIETVPQGELLDLVITKALLQMFFTTGNQYNVQDILASEEIYTFTLENSTVVNIQRLAP